MKRNCLRLLASVGLAALFSLALPSPALAQGYLGANLRPFAVLAGTTVTCPVASTVTGDVGVSPGSAIVGFPAPCTDIGTLHGGDATAAAAQSDLTAAYLILAGQSCAATVGPNLAGLTLTQGVYCVGTAVSNLTGLLQLDAQGNSNAVFVFKMSSTLITSPNSTVSVINGGNACGVQWQVSSSATIDTNTTFVGNILALTAITMNTGGNLTGRALARNAAVTLNGINVVSFAACGAGGTAAGVPPPFTPVGVLAGVAKAFSPNVNGPGGISTLTITLTNPNATAATLTAALVDSLPPGVVIAASPNASTTCGGGLVTATAGGSSVTLSAGSTIPGGAPGSCTVIANVTSATPGTYTNTIAVNALQTSNGNNIVPAIATLTIGAAISPVPTLSEWAMIMLAALLCLCGFFAIRQRRMTH